MSSSGISSSVGGYRAEFLTAEQQVRVVSTLDQVVSTQCFKHKTKSCKTGQVVSTLAQVVSTLDQLPETFWVKLGQCVDTSSSSVDTRELPRTPYGLFWDSVSTLDQLVSTLVALP
ncbi:hypothetical protein Taro_056790 [Colocasia esculenta]|uniref:Uncharacterized protein n=1 Tax=Colocasia esculenta TaxID=4460 RepID=A0A843XX76_COLES|nr:hypothetical protein [Colocasia esculenta]